eukprot:6111483-Amphidinium_carterae.2
MFAYRAQSCHDLDAMRRLEGKVDRNRIVEGQERYDRLTSRVVGHVVDLKPVTNKTRSDKSWHGRVCKYWEAAYFWRNCIPTSTWYEANTKGTDHECVVAEHIYHHGQVSSGAT